MCMQKSQISGKGGKFIGKHHILWCQIIPVRICKPHLNIFIQPSAIIDTWRVTSNHINLFDKHHWTFLSINGLMACYKNVKNQTKC